jgi:hypothetical protein
MKTKLLIAGAFLLGALAGSAWNGDHANAEGLRSRRVVATIAKQEFTSRDGNGVRIERALLEGHDVWMAIGYLNFGLAHHPDCELCELKDGTDAFALTETQP